MELSYPPFEMSDSNNQPAGISVEIASALAKRLGRQATIVNLPFDGLIPSLKTGKIDLILSSMTVTAERSQAVDFSIPYISTGLAILAAKDSAIHSYKDLDRPGAKIAVKKGTTGHLWAIKNLKSSRILLLDKETTAVLEVSQQKADAFLYDQMSVFRNWSKYRSETRPILSAFQEEHWAIAVKKGNDVLLQQINEFLLEFKKERGFERLGDIYLQEEKKAFHELGVKFIF